jgi:hypothetical protein
LVVERSEAYARAADRLRELFAGYEPPGFGHVIDADAALFLCAVDHKTGYRRAHEVDGRGPFSGSELMWELGLRRARSSLRFLTAARLRRIGPDEVAGLFAVDEETVADPHRRAALWRDLGVQLEARYRGGAAALLEACGGRLGGDDGLVRRLRAFQAYSDPLAKKAFLFAKICERRGWLEVGDPESWEVAADNVLMRLALRSGLVAEGELDDVRAATRAAFKQLAGETRIPVPALDDLLWELGRDDPDLLGAAAGDLREPPRDSASAWY